MSSWFGRGRGGGGAKSTTMRTSAAIASDLGREHRIEIHLGNFREVGDELRDVDDDVGDRIAVGGIAAAHAFQHLMGLDAVQHRQRILLGRGREAEGDVLQHLDQHAAEPERHQLAERAVGHRTDDDFLAAQQHLLHLDAFDLGVRLVFLGVRQDRRVILFHVIGGLDAHHHAAGFGLVQNVRRDDFHHHRKTHAGRELDRLGRGFGHALLRNRDAVGVADQFALGRRETAALVCLDRVENFANRILGMRHWLLPDVRFFIKLPRRAALWHLVCQKQSCQATLTPANAENKGNLTRWYLVCQKTSGFILLRRRLLLEEISRARTETNQGAAHHG